MPRVQRNASDYKCVNVVTQIITSFVKNGQVVKFSYTLNIITKCAKILITGKSSIFSVPKAESTEIPPFAQNESYLTLNADSSLSLKNYLARDSRKIWYPIFFGSSQEITDLCNEYSYFNIAGKYVTKLMQKIFNFF